jgi:hypothetical protein
MEGWLRSSDRGLSPLALGATLLSGGSLLRPADARERDERHEQDVEEFRRNFNHCRGPRPRESRTRGMQSS